MLLETVRYVRETFRTENGSFSFWRPEGQTIDQSLEMLLETYAKATARRTSG
jgi:hypothetical protein